MTQKIGGKGRHEVLIMFNNEGDTGLKDVTLKDVIPENFEIKDWIVRGNGNKRDDCEMTSESGDGGTHLAWHIPLVGKGEEIMISFDITGPGAIDGELGNIFHGVHFGDEDESEIESLPETVEDDEETNEDPVEEATEETSESEEESTEDGSEEEAENKVSWREDVLLRVMDSAGIDEKHRDEFVIHAANFDLDDNGYLKKAELEAAAKAWNENSTDGDSEETSGDAEAEEATEEIAEEASEGAEPEEATEEDAAEESSDESSSDEKACPICAVMCPKDATTCSVCSFAFI